MTNRTQHALHEAGHAVAAVVLNIPGLQCVSLAIDDESNGHALLDLPADYNPLHCAVVALAGPMAEGLLSGDGKTYEVAGADFQFFHASTDRAADKDHTRHEALSIAESLVRSNEENIRTVAEALVLHGDLTGDQIRSLVFPLACGQQEPGPEGFTFSGVAS